MIPTIKRLQPIPTGKNGTPTGFVLPIWNSAFDEYRPEQCYLTTVMPGCQKGPHLHMRRRGAFTVIRGTLLIVTRSQDGRRYYEHLAGEGSWKTVFVPAGIACALYNPTSVEAFVLNMPSPPWVDNSDEQEVEDWLYRPPATFDFQPGCDWRVFFKPNHG